MEKGYVSPNVQGGYLPAPCAWEYMQDGKLRCILYYFGVPSCGVDCPSFEAVEPGEEDGEAEGG